MSAETATSDVPIVSEHAHDRWDERTNPTSVAPETAWLHAQRVAADGPFLNVDELRYHRATRTLLLYDSPTITTVYSVDNLTDRAHAAVEHALEDTHE